MTDPTKAFFDAAQPVSSAFISHLGYIPEARVLVVGFKSAPDSLNCYHDCPAETWDLLRDASSKGRVFQEQVRSKGFRVVIVRKPTTEKESKDGNA